MATHGTSVKNAFKAALADDNAANDIFDTLEGNKVQTRRGGGSTAEVTDRWGDDDDNEGLEVRVIDEVVTLTNAASVSITSTVPAGAVIKSVQANLQTAVTGDGSGDDLGAKIGVGIVGDENKYGVTSGLTKNLKVDTIPAHAVLGSAEQIKFYMLKTDGATAATEKFSSGGQIRIKVVYEMTNSLADAS